MLHRKAEFPNQNLIHGRESPDSPSLSCAMESSDEEEVLGQEMTPAAQVPLYSVVGWD